MDEDPVEPVGESGDLAGDILGLARDLAASDFGNRGLDLAALRGLDLGGLSSVAAAQAIDLAAKQAAAPPAISLSRRDYRTADQMLLEAIQGEMAELREVTVDQARNVAIQVAAAQRQADQLDRLVATIERSTKVTERLEWIAVILAVVAIVLAAIQVAPIVWDALVVAAEWISAQG